MIYDGTDEYNITKKNKILFILFFFSIIIFISMHNEDIFTFKSRE